MNKIKLFISILIVISFIMINNSFADDKYPFSVNGCSDPQYLTEEILDGQGSSVDVSTFECPKESLESKIAVDSNLISFTELMT